MRLRYVRNQMRMVLDEFRCPRSRRTTRLSEVLGAAEAVIEPRVVVARVGFCRRDRRCRARTFSAECSVVLTLEKPTGMSSFTETTTWVRVRNGL